MVIDRCWCCIATVVTATELVLVAGHPCRSSGHIRTRGNMRKGGMNAPPALIPHTKVMVCPRSAETTFTTRLVPQGDSTLGMSIDCR